MNKRLRSKNIVVISLMILTFLIVIGISLSQVIDMYINDRITNQNSDKGLTCKIKIDTTTTVNITWYKGGIQNRTSNISCTNGVECGTSEGSGNIPNTETRKGEVWLCKAEFINSTGGYETSNVSVNIVNTPPYEPRIFFNSNGTEIFNDTVIITEDNTTLFNVTSWDWDGDAITYVLDANPSFCDINSLTGIMNCSPTAEADVRNWTFSVGAKTGAITGTGRSININVTPNNDAPRFNPILINKNLTEGQKLNYHIIGVDDENNIPLNLEIINVTPYLNLTITRLTDKEFILMLRNNDSTTFAESKINYTVTLILSDTDNITYNNRNATASFNLIGINFNHLPNISYIVYNNNSLRQGNDLNIYINATDIDNNTLTFYTNNSLYPIAYNSTTDHELIPNESFAYAWINITNLSNDNVINHTFTIFSFDTNENANKSIVMFINNTNDNPIIHEIDTSSGNTFNNTNISALIGHTGTLFKYHINATDPDDLTYDYLNTGIKNYTTNDSNFYINRTTGILEFTPSTEGNYTFIVTVTDGAGATYNQTASIEVFLNRNPIFTTTPIIIYCNELDQYNWNYSCYYNISNNTADLDLGDYITSFWTNSTLFQINSTTGIINFSANQSMIGNHSIKINITDTYNALTTDIMYLIINNTNNPPSMHTPSVPQENFIVGNTYQIVYDASDMDLNLSSINENLSYENLTFESIITGPNVSIFSLQKISDTEAILSITPISSDYDGNYSINVTVTDYYGNISYYHMYKYIYNITASPNIIQIIPSGTPFNNTINNVTWRNTTDFNNTMTTIRIFENQTFTFNQTSIADNSSYPNSLEYYWYYDNNLVSTNSYYQKYFDFISNDTHNLTFIAQDQYFSNSSFTWTINITNVNRLSIYNNHSIENLTVSGSGFIPGYLTYSDLRRRFYDPDDDLENLGYTTDNTTKLVFSSTACSYANFTFEYNRLNINAYEIGECLVIFNATDLYNNLSISSEVILINITNISESTQEPVPTPIQSSGGGTSNTPTPIPLPIEIERLRPLQIITPQLVTMYKNDTIKVPIIINNTWNDTLLGITLEAYTNSSNVSLYLDRIYIPKLNKGESVEATLYIKNYKSEGHYEIQLIANVSVPSYKDIATIFINSAEMNSEGDELENKISFAKDLLSSNPECQELNELILQARTELDKNNYVTTAKIIDDVLNGCKYLVNNAKSNSETPNRNFVKTFEWKKTYNDYILLGIFGLLFVISLIYILKKDNPEHNF